MGGTWVHERGGSLFHTSYIAKNGIYGAFRPLFHLPYTYYLEKILGPCSARNGAFFEHYFSLFVQCIFGQRCTHGGVTGSSFREAEKCAIRVQKRFLFREFGK